MTEPTQQQIALAQQAGDKAYAEALGRGEHTSVCYEAYRAALNDELDRQEREAVEMDSRIAYTDQRVEDVQPLAEATMEKWHEYLAGMSPAEVALYNIWKENHATTDQP